SGKAPSLDPVARWFQVVGKPLLDKRPARQTRRNAAYASAIEELMGDKLIIRSIREDGTPVTSAGEASIAEYDSEYVAKEGTFLCAALARHVIEVLHHRGDAAQGAGHMIPVFSEYFSLFDNRDDLLKNRKSFVVR